MRKYIIFVITEILIVYGYNNGTGIRDYIYRNKIQQDRSVTMEHSSAPLLVFFQDTTVNIVVYFQNTLKLIRLKLGA